MIYRQIESAKEYKLKYEKALAKAEALLPPGVTKKDLQQMLNSTYSHH
jgi:hypothetical protein